MDQLSQYQPLFCQGIGAAQRIGYKDGALRAILSLISIILVYILGVPVLVFKCFGLKLSAYNDSPG
jgi:hypothetical protein